MRQSTFVLADPPTQAQPLRSPEGTRGADARDELGLISRDVALRTGALTAIIVAGTPIDVVGAWETGPSPENLTLGARRSGFVGRVLESGHTAGEHMRNGKAAQLGWPASAGRVTYAAGAAVNPPGGPSGALCVGLPKPPGNEAVTLWVVESYARLTSLCLYETGTLDGLLAQARLDALTGCLNYSAIHAEVEREIGRCVRHERTMACCFVDLDRFKQVNDRHGHPCGSRVLAEIAAVLRGGVRIGDIVGRYGGDEFVVLLPDTDRDAALALAERLRSMICSISVKGGNEPLDASIGIAQWRFGMTTDELLAAADEALLDAKRAGGGNVVRAGDVAVGAGRDVAGATPGRSRRRRSRAGG